MKQLGVVFVMAAGWLLFTGVYSMPNFIEGAIVSGVIVFITRVVKPFHLIIIRILRLIGFFFFFLYELVLANLKIAWDIITPRHRMTPGIVAVPLDANTDFEITLLSILITLTPGTLSLDISDDRKLLFVHVMYLDSPESVIKEIKTGFERRILEILR